MAFRRSPSATAIRAARQHGIFVDSATLTFGYVNDRDNVVDDFDAPDLVAAGGSRGSEPEAWLHIKWYVCDPQDRWCTTSQPSASHPMAGSGAWRSRYSAHRQKIGRHPDLPSWTRVAGTTSRSGPTASGDWF